MNIDRKWGPAGIRTWTLILNLGANGLALYGLVEFLRDGGGLLLLISGVALTLLCIAILSTPGQKDPDHRTGTPKA